ncbi:unnamed protein product [Amoebophrya sp. A120]|nr:unnamed protein product [Amoebophrya sp. A120]|eukprot:GSA120T00009595001.1
MISIRFIDASGQKKASSRWILEVVVVVRSCSAMAKIVHVLLYIFTFYFKNNDAVHKLYRRIKCLVVVKLSNNHEDSSCARRDSRSPPAGSDVILPNRHVRFRKMKRCTRSRQKLFTYFHNAHDAICHQPYSTQSLSLMSGFLPERTLVNVDL